MADVREIQVRLNDDHWVRVEETIFRSWTGPRRLNGEDYTGPVYVLGTDTKVTDWPPNWPAPEDADEAKEREWYDEDDSLKTECEQCGEYSEESEALFDSQDRSFCSEDCRTEFRYDEEAAE